MRLTAGPSLARALELSPDEVLERLSTAGRSGADLAAFAARCRAFAAAPGGRKLVVCNAQETTGSGRASLAILARDPHAVVEGMTAVARATGAGSGIVAAPAPAGPAHRSAAAALEHARRAGLLGAAGPPALGGFDVDVWVGGGERVCGEPGALVDALAGRLPMARPPASWERGPGGAPTLVAGTLEWVRAAQAVRDHPVADAPSPAAVVLWLAGPLHHGGLAEVPASLPLRAVVDGAGGGMVGPRALKAVLVGGIGGTFVPFADMDRPIGSLAAGDVAADVLAIGTDVCVLCTCQELLEEVVASSCGKCPPCRTGARVLLDLAGRVARGDGSGVDLAEMEDLARHIRRTSLCRLGQLAAEPLLSALAGFRAELESHLSGCCPAGRCTQRPA